MLYLDPEEVKIYDSLVNSAEPTPEAKPAGEIYDPGDDLAASEYAPENYVPNTDNPENYIPKNDDPALRLKTEDAKMDSLPVRTVEDNTTDIKH